MRDFTDLVVLIGTNPLPNYVVAEYFLKKVAALQNVWLVHSEVNKRQEGTKQQAEHLEKLLKEKHGAVAIRMVPLSDVSYARQTFRDLREKLLEEILKKRSPDTLIHVNYTGGTKVMGTHVYRAIEQESQVKGRTSFSYLDGRNFCIIGDEEGCITPDLRDEISITFQELIELHGFRREGSKRQDVFSPAIAVFHDILQTGGLNEYFQRDVGYDGVLFENKDKPGKLAEAVPQLKDALKKYKPNIRLQSVIDAMPGRCRLFHPDGSFDATISDDGCKDAIKFLDGGWLEEYVYTIMHEVLSPYNNTQIVKNWCIKKEGWSTQFELDVLALRGYQLIGISCTTGNKKGYCKNKGFEIMQRSRQIGGDEARAMLVTRLNNKNISELQDELKYDTGSTEKSILVLGEEDLKEPRLKNKLSDFLQLC